MTIVAQAAEQYRRFSESDVQVGEPLPWSVYDAAGHLLLARGVVVNTENQRNRLLNQNIFVSLAEVAAGLGKQAGKRREEVPAAGQEVAHNAFELIDRQIAILDQAYRDLSSGSSGVAISAIRNLSVALYKQSLQHHDALLAAVYLNGSPQYSQLKAIHVALLVNELASLVDLAPKIKLSLIAAGLTHDIGMWELQNETRTRKEPLTEQQWLQIKQHCVTGVDLLRESGVDDPVWLQAIAQHHERLNGSGYHGGLKEKEITLYGRILALADVYSAMVRSRGDRGKMMPKDAMREIFLSRGEEIDGTLVQLFIKKIGMFPPRLSATLGDRGGRCSYWSWN